ncbi:hypothetical protein LL01C4_38060 [Escherichia coli]
MRVSELLLLEKHSIKPNIQGGQFSIIVTSVDDDVRDPRKRLPSLKNSWAHRVLALDINDYNHLKIYIDKISKNTSHNFIFTSTKSNLPPLSYHSIYDIFSKIDCVFKKEYPQFSDEKSIDSVVSITPHVTRHTWAYLILKRIYAAKYQSVMRNCKLAGVDFAIAGLMSEAKDELRLLGGWSHNSRMPEFYARRFLSERANFSNVRRIAADSSEDEIFSLIHQAFREVIK